MCFGMERSHPMMYSKSYNSPFPCFKTDPKYWPDDRFGTQCVWKLHSEFGVLLQCKDGVHTKWNRHFPCYSKGMWCIPGIYVGYCTWMSWSNHSVCDTPNPAMRFKMMAWMPFFACCEAFVNVLNVCYDIITSPLFCLLRPVMLFKKYTAKLDMKLQW